MNRDDYEMPWLGELLPGRLYVGPFPGTQADARYLQERLHVTHIINMVPETDAVTRSATWYMCYYSSTAQVRLPIPDDEGTARRVVKLLQEPDSVVYIHNRTGFHQEAVLGFVVWALFDPTSFPKEDIAEWKRRNGCERLLNDAQSHQGHCGSCAQRPRALASHQAGPQRIKRRETQRGRRAAGNEQNSGIPGGK